MCLLLKKLIFVCKNVFESEKYRSFVFSNRRGKEIENIFGVLGNYLFNPLQHNNILCCIELFQLNWLYYTLRLRTTYIFYNNKILKEGSNSICFSVLIKERILK